MSGAFNGFCIPSRGHGFCEARGGDWGNREDGECCGTFLGWTWIFNGSYHQQLSEYHGDVMGISWRHSEPYG
jgi:hypothetical protein